MVNGFNSFYILARRFNRKYFELKLFFNITDTTEVVNKDDYYNKFFDNNDFLNMHFRND